MNNIFKAGYDAYIVDRYIANPYVFKQSKLLYNQWRMGWLTAALESKLSSKNANPV